MAASDKPYHNQHALDVVFGASSLLMLVSIVAMFVQDYNREYKFEQRIFRDVETAMAQRLALLALPSGEEIEKADEAVKEARAVRAENDSKIKGFRAKVEAERPNRDRANDAYQNIKAEWESIVSFYNIEVEKHGPKSKEAEKLFAKIDDLNKKLDAAKAKIDSIAAVINENQSQADALEADLTKKLSRQKQIYDRFDSLVKTSLVKQWKIGDTIRNLPILDGFAAPTKIQQITNNDIPIDYYFKPVTRFDRCTTCHLGIDRPAYAAEELAKLTRDPKLDDDLKEAKRILASRRALLAGLPDQAAVADPKTLQLTSLSPDRLTPSRIREFAAHPRLDLFVGSDSKHPMEKFGCTTCHSGQGSGTSFTWASHVPNSPKDRERWIQNNHWHEVHAGDWDYPMHPQRFIESSCLKCHHQVTDLVSRDGREEAPKLLRGYRIIREFGCFGCHEISGTKGGKAVGPDLRAEPSTPVDEMTAAERARAESDPDNKPGKLRRVGPSLVRLAEKTNPEWTAKWIRSPRSFRPDTKMPHYFGVANNDPSVLPEDQKQFPDAEIQAITHYLFKLSNNQIKEAAKVSASAEAVKKDADRLAVLEVKTPLNDAEKKEVEEILRRRTLRKVAPLVDVAKDHKADAARGQQLFVERGCLACHSHQSTQSVLPSQAEFGPNLTQVAEKLGAKKGDKASARVWLTQWILNPQFHSSRSRMPVTHLEPGQAADIAEWILSQSPKDLGDDWKDLAVAPADEETLKNLAKVYLVRLLPGTELKKFLEEKTVSDAYKRDLPQDERTLIDEIQKDSKEALLTYVGRKAVSRLGCYACHEIPGYDTAKPIGVALNDWGKKDATRLAFEDIVNYVREKFDVVDSLTDKDGNPIPFKESHGAKKPTYERFFAEMLDHHGQNRMGYLNQKLIEPRSYDYNRIRAWDDRSRMPQFRFSRLKKNADESEEEFEARKHKAEADARESVMTFILGLTAESLPAKAVNQPTGDRAAEVRGRQVLENFNCAGCHLIRPGYFEFKPSENALKFLGDADRKPDDHYFPGHSNWTGPTPPADRIPVHGLALSARADKRVDPDDPSSPLRIPIRPMDAIRYKDPVSGAKDVFASRIVSLPANDLIYPKLSDEITTDSKLLSKALRDRAYGGSFADELTKYLSKKDPKTYKADPAYDDSSDARPAVPPSLHGQGERTQAEWLYDFLLNPYPVRKMSVLRMPKFNLSPEDSKALVDYFSGVARLNNPGAASPAGFEEIPQQAPAVREGYFRQKNAEYVARLKAAKAPNGKTLFEQKLEEYQPLFEEIQREGEAKKATAKSRFDTFAAKVKDAETAEAGAKKKLDDAAAAAKKAAEGDKKKAEAEAADAAAKHAVAKAALEAEQRNRDLWEKELDRSTAFAAQNSLDGQKAAFAEKDAYLADAYRLVMNKNLCVQCHQVGNFIPKNQVMGPPLHLAHERLRPGWAQRWIAHPERFVPYSSSMPPLFTPDKLDNYADVFPGTPLERVTAARDVLMAFPETLALPLNRHWTLPSPAAEKK